MSERERIARSAAAGRGRVPASMLVYVVSSSAFLAQLAQSIYVPLLGDVEERLGGSALLVNLSLSLYTAGLCAAQLVYGPLADRVGRRAVLLPALALFAVGSGGCALAGSIAWLLVWRVVQAAGVGAGSVVAAAVIADLFAGPARARAMARYQMLVSLGHVIGPLAGAVVGPAFGYRGVFVAALGSGLAVLAANAAYLPETLPPAQRPRPLRARDLGTILRHPIGAATSLLAFVQWFGFYNFIVFLPRIAARVYMLAPSAKGTLLLPLTVAVIVGSLGGGALAGRFDARRVLLVSSAVNVVVLAAFAVLGTQGLAVLIGLIVAFGVSTGVAFPLQTTLLTEAFVAERATSVGVYNLVRFAGMAAGPLVGAALDERGGAPLVFGVSAFIFALALAAVGALFRAAPAREDKGGGAR